MRETSSTLSAVVVSTRGAERWRGGHPWIYRSDVRAASEPADPGIVQVTTSRGRSLGRALFSPRSEIRLRMLSRADASIDRGWWVDKLSGAVQRRQGISSSAYRVAFAEADGVPSLVVDRYGDYVVAQLLSAGIEAVRVDVISAIEEVLSPRGILLRHDTRVRAHEGLATGAELASGTVPEVIEVSEFDVRYRVRPWTGQKTGAFLDQRENRRRVGSRARGRTLDVFAYEGGFALHMARQATSVLAIEQSGDALERGRAAAADNQLANVEWREANAFDALRGLERDRERFDTIVLDPPAFVKTKANVARGLAGYKEINLRAMRLLRPGGHLFSFSCSYHVGRRHFLEVIAAAARDSNRRLALDAVLGQAADHPEILTIPETGYLTGVEIHAVD